MAQAGAPEQQQGQPQHEGEPGGGGRGVEGCADGAAAADAAADAAPFDAEALLAPEGRRRTYGLLRTIVSAFHGVPGVVGLHGGMPPDAAFPLTSLSFSTADGVGVELSPQQLADAQQYNVSLPG